MQVSIESSTKTAVRKAVVCGRKCERKELLENPANVQNTGAIVLLLKGQNGTVAGGHGPVFERFVQTGQITGFPGEGTPITKSDDPNFATAQLKLMQFHETYKKIALGC